MEDSAPPADLESLIIMWPAEVYLFGRNDFSGGSLSEITEIVTAAIIPKTTVAIIILLYLSRTAIRSIREISSSFSTGFVSRFSMIIPFLNQNQIDRIYINIYLNVDSTLSRFRRGLL